MKHNHNQKPKSVRHITNPRLTALAMLAAMNMAPAAAEAKPATQPTNPEAQKANIAARRAATHLGSEIIQAYIQAKHNKKEAKVRVYTEKPNANHSSTIKNISLMYDNKQSLIPGYDGKMTIGARIRVGADHKLHGSNTLAVYAAEGFPENPDSTSIVGFSPLTQLSLQRRAAESGGIAWDVQGSSTLTKGPGEVAVYGTTEFGPDMMSAAQTAGAGSTIGTIIEMARNNQPTGPVQPPLLPGNKQI